MSEPKTYWKVKKNPENLKWEAARGRIAKGWEVGWTENINKAKGTVGADGSNVVFEKDLPKDAIKGRYKNAKRTEKAKASSSSSNGTDKPTPLQLIQTAKKEAGKRIAVIDALVKKLAAERASLVAVSKLK